MYRDKNHTYSNLDRDALCREILAVADAVKDIAFVGGGAARYLYSAKAPVPSDIDLFLLDDNPPRFVAASVALAAAGYPERGRQGSAFVHTNLNARLPVQLVPPVAYDALQQRSEARVEMKRYGSPRTVLEGFTFFVEQFALEATPGGYRLTWTDHARTDLQRQRLRLNRIANPIYATWRIAKYARKGFKISLVQLQELFRLWDGLPLEERELSTSFWADDTNDFYRGLQGMTSPRRDK